MFQTTNQIITGAPMAWTPPNKCRSFGSCDPPPLKCPIKGPCVKPCQATVFHTSKAMSMMGQRSVAENWKVTTTRLRALSFK